MPWDPKPQPPVQPSPQPTPSAPSAAPHGLPQSNYPSYEANTAAAPNGQARIKTEPGVEPQYNGLPNAYQQNPIPTQGGIARAQQLLQQNYGNAASASLNAMQQRGGLALPGQPVKPPTGLQLPSGSPTDAQRNFQLQQQAAMQRQQHQLQQHHQHQQPPQSRVKTENGSPSMPQGGFDQKPAQPAYGQTDGADDALDEWRAQLAQRRALAAQETQHADRMMHDRIAALSQNMQSGLMLPLDEHTKRSKKQRQTGPSQREPVHLLPVVVAGPSTIPQLDGDFDDDSKGDVKDDDEDDENAINSDLDDTDDEGQGAMGDDDDDLGDSILCTYDKVQRVKNKWKCTLKDGVMSVKGREWVFHKGTGEFEW